MFPVFCADVRGDDELQRCGWSRGSEGFLPLKGDLEAENPPDVEAEALRIMLVV